MSSEPPDLFGALIALARDLPEARTYAEAEPHRLDACCRYLAEGFPLDQTQALGFTQDLHNRLSLIMKRGLHGLHDGPLTPEDRVRLAQQEADYLILTALARGLFEQQFGSGFEQEARSAPRPLIATDSHHPRDLDPHAPWTVDASRLDVEMAQWRPLWNALAAGDVAATPLIDRQALLPEVLSVRARQLASTGTLDFAQALGSLQAGYALGVAYRQGIGNGRSLANHALDPAQILGTLADPARDPSRRFPNLLLEQALSEIRRALRSAEGWDREREVALQGAQREGLLAALLEELHVSPVPAARRYAGLRIWHPRCSDSSL